MYYNFFWVKCSIISAKNSLFAFSTLKFVNSYVTKLYGLYGGGLSNFSLKLLNLYSFFVQPALTKKNQMSNQAYPQWGFIYSYFLKKFLEDTYNLKNKLILNKYSTYSTFLNFLGFKNSNKIRYLSSILRSFDRVVSMLELISTVLITKDVSLFKNWFKDFLESVFYKYHKKIFYLLKWFFSTYFYYFRASFNVLGIFMQVKGKISLGGNAKKKKLIMKEGLTSYTNKQLRLSSSFFQVRTSSGTLGISFAIFY